MNPFSSVVKTWLKSIGVVASLLCLLMIIAPQASASAWEWITDTTIPPSCCSTGQNVKITWRTNVSSSSYEYASLYFFVAASSTDPNTIGDSTAWNEWTSCRRSGLISSGYRQENCTVTLPTVTEDKKIFFRTTTNYAGCGSWTATPDRIGCGDAYTTYRMITP
jgi:hypothetical protein